MDLRQVSKAIAGATASAIAATGSALVVVPDSVVMPWWGYVLVGIINAGIGFAAVYLAPANSSA
ncbi:hypothetical protein [Propylenella binzhouense]|uniref:Uncharacterized protein n=1 Tax=Propylenella binzhouense TaxID=2555902 RepID=A0A964T9R2_9HYPH|nr:hypothetical protein [Propylenella binzhouense]MYZ50399.1 hypothetical protein [Propylenella binzhouense]